MQASKTKQRIYPEQIPESVNGADVLDLIELPEGGDIAVLILGNYNGAFMAAHFGALTDDQYNDSRYWYEGADVIVKFSWASFDAIEAEARLRWPQARFFRTPGCLCCNGEENLLEYDCER